MIPKAYKSYKRLFATPKKSSVVSVRVERSGAIKFDVDSYLESDAGRKELRRIASAWERKKAAIRGA